jgi:benzoyl-CoA reductase subunit D
MITAGIDCGAKTVKVVILKDGEVVGRGLVPAGIDTRGASEKAFEEAFRMASVGADEVQKVVSTGVGKEGAFRHDSTVTEVTADARGAVRLFPRVRTVVDVGAEESRAIRVDASGRVVDFVINDKCAAGAGVFVEAMARALDVDLEEMGRLSLQATKTVRMNAQCVVFAESELVSLVHAKTPKSDMARAVHDAIADRIVSMIRRVGLEEEVLLIGGMARNIGFVDSLERELQTQVLIPEEPELVGALGAAIIAGNGA